MPMDKFELGIVIPTYNEVDNIEELIFLIQKELSAHKIKAILLIVDDNSPDKTGDVVQKLSGRISNSFFELRLLRRLHKNGLASAYKEGFIQLKSQCVFLVSMDGDFSHQPKYLLYFLNKIKEGYDFIIGSRYMAGGSVENWHWFRKLISKGGSWYCRLILGHKIHDYTGGFNMYRSAIMNADKLKKMKAEGYLFQIEIKYPVAEMVYKYAEIPIVFPDRKHGKSKFSKAIMLEAIWGVWRLKFTSLKP